MAKSQEVVFDESKRESFLLDMAGSISGEEGNFSEDLEEAEEIEIDGRRIGSCRAPYVVAEMSGNHRGEFAEAVRIVEAAAAAGADAVKLQTYKPESITLPCARPAFQIEGTVWSGRSLYELYREAYTPWEWQPRLQQIAASLGLTLFSTPFDTEAVDFLEAMDVPAYKIASFELVDLPLLRRVGRTGKPVLLSTGMATRAEIDEAVATLRASGTQALALLKCTSAYPAPADQMHLRTLGALARLYRVPVGLSDHSLELAVPVAAVALGASIIEKHLTLSRKAGGCDAAFSLEPEEFRTMVHAVRTAHQAVGAVQLGPSRAEADSRRYRRSLYVVEEIAAGDLLTERNIRSIRPGDGLHPRYLDRVLGRPARCALARGTPLRWEHVG